MTKKDSLLVSLSSYRPRPGRHPIEDFITEAFAWLLRAHGDLGTAFIKGEILNRIDDEDFESPEISDVQWSTQVSFDESRPDMVASVGDVTVAFEHKVHAQASSGQLKRHRKGLQTQHGDGILVLITSAKWHYADPADVKMTWPTVYRWLDEKADESSSSAMIREFLALLESRGLAPRAAIEENSLRAYFPAKKVEDQIDSIFRTLLEREEAWDFLFEQAPHLDRGQARIKGKAGKIPVEGRLGIRFTPWSPGLFVGVLLDGNDHKVGMSNPDLGPDLVVVLDVRRKGVGELSRQEFLNSRLYSQLASRLERESTNREWEVVDTHSRPERGNPWHPLILRRPLATVLRGKEDQIDTILQTLVNGVQFLLDGGEVREAGAL